MTYPKPISQQSLTAARERLLAANINPDDEIYAEKAPMQPCRIVGTFP